MATVSGRGGASALRSLWNRRTDSRCRRLFSLPPRCSSLQPPDVPLLAETARISLSPKEVEDFAPKICQVVDWFGQLQAVDLESIQPSFRADTDTEVNADLREDSPEPFENREAILAAVPRYDVPYIKVPIVINKE